MRIEFSAAIAASDGVMRDHALILTGGSVTGARGVDGRSDLWEITITPDAGADVWVILPASSNCSAQGSICTADQRPLSNRTEVTVRAPAPTATPTATAAPTATATATPTATDNTDRNATDRDRNADRDADCRVGDSTSSLAVGQR